MIIISALSSRDEFGTFLNDKKLLGHAVEVGCHRGDFALPFLSNWNGKCYHGIDPWNIPIGYEIQAKLLWGGGNREEDYQACIRVSKQFENRVILHRTTSQKAIDDIILPPLDFVYVDGDHSFEAVKYDICNWWMKIRKGGILAGHDWHCPGEKDGGWGRNIQMAVDLFRGLYEVDVNLIIERDGLPWSFYIEKV